MSDETIVLAIGDSAPDFNAADFAGKPFKLSSSLSEGPVVLIFLRGFR
jgi:peroxiredoxin